MAKPGLSISDVKINFRLRDFFLDFMACIVPGLIFLISITFIVGGVMIIFLVDDSIQIILKQPIIQEWKDIIGNILSSFSFNFWFLLIITFLSYFAGHLLYRQTPKVPDFASFLRIRRKVIKKEGDDVSGEAGSWVIERGKGIRAKDVQFPYSNLKMYLKCRGFHHLLNFIDWSPDKGQRSKTLINKAKIRVAFLFPEQTMHIIRNEAHIRLASSMWYAARYTLLASYVTLLALTIYLIKNSWPLDKNEKLFFYSIISMLIGGYLLREIASLYMKIFSKKSYEEKRARLRAFLIDVLWRLHDLLPLLSNLFLLIGTIFYVSLRGLTEQANLIIVEKKELILIYLGLQAFILIGTLFGKYRIEDTIHYQRVREIIYVLETAFLSNVLDIDSKSLPDPFRAQKFSHDINLRTSDKIDLKLKAQ